jgi:hypothetical protein
MTPQEYEEKKRESILYRMRLKFPKYSDEFLWRKHNQYLHLVNNVNEKYEIIELAILEEFAKYVKK